MMVLIDYLLRFWQSCSFFSENFFVRQIPSIPTKTYKRCFEEKAVIVQINNLFHRCFSSKRFSPCFLGAVHMR